MKSLTRTSVLSLAPSVRAPELRRVVEVLMAQPTDRRAKIRRVLLEKEGALDCPACGVPFAPSGYRATRTSYGHTESLCCTGCRTTFIVDEGQIV
ncbi:MAG: hypothetical protein A2138_04060 [Deltaproteobacteria bacterium RBG_16_71_12]|nr:MAG: hypothetical protein A2138_04060 [Deltaproteobacteria bacterium RBG_16_71_12]